MSETVGVREFRNRVSYYLRRAQAGERITVTDRGAPIATVQPAAADETERAIWRMVEEGRAAWRGRKPALPVPVKIGGRPISEIVIEHRG